MKPPLDDTGARLQYRLREKQLYDNLPTFTYGNNNSTTTSNARTTLNLQKKQNNSDFNFRL